MLASEAFRRLQVAKCLPVKHIGVFKAQNSAFMSGFSTMCEVTLRGLPYGGPWPEREEKSISGRYMLASEAFGPLRAQKIDFCVGKSIVFGASGR